MIKDVVLRKEILKKFFYDEKTRELCRLEGKNTFSRNRKIKFTDILLMTYNKQAKTTSMEIRNYEKNLKGKEKVEYTNEAYLKQRRNLNPEVFKAANVLYLQNFYESNKVIKNKNYVLLAIDGSKFEVPNTPQNREFYGVQKTQHERQPARANVSTIYDVNNHFYLDSKIDKYSKSEKVLAKENIENALKIVDAKDIIVIFDRNYSSLEFFLWLKEHNLKFIMRLSESYYKKERNEMKTDDEYVKIQHTYPRLQNLRPFYPKECKKLEEMKETELRITNIKLKSGKSETLISNLSYEEFNKQELKKIYEKRWSIETSYDSIKSKLKIESFTGTLPILIEQDLYSQILVYNQLQDMIYTGNEKLKEKIKGKKLKLEYKINENIAIGIFKEEMIKVLLIENDKKSNEMFNNLIEEMTNYASSIRDGRQSLPRLFNRANRYKTNMKSSF